MAHSGITSIFDVCPIQHPTYAIRKSRYIDPIISPQIDYGMLILCDHTHRVNDCKADLSDEYGLANSYPIVIVFFINVHLYLIDRQL